MTAVEVCVVTYRSETTLPRMIESLSILGGDVSLAVHDNSPAGGGSLAVAVDVAARVGIPVRVESCSGTDGNCGFAAACNSLAAASSADLVLFLNPDAALISTPLRRGSVPAAVIGPLIQDDAGKTMHSFGRSRGLAAEALLRWARLRPSLPVGTGYVSGAAMLIPRELFVAVGGFDPAYFMYYEDIDFCRRAVRLGFEVRVDPSWRVRHTGGASAKGDPTAALLRSYQSGRRFHALDDLHANAYDLVCLIDAALRVVLWSLRVRTRPRAAAYAALLRCVWRTMREGGSVLV